MRFLERMAGRLGFARVQKTGTWEKLWLRAIESTLLGNQVTQPYSQHWAVYLAISKIAMNIANTPFVLWRGDDQVWDHPVISLFERPNPYFSRYQLWESTAVYLNLKGEAFWVLESSRGMEAGVRGSLPAAIYVLNPERFRAAVDSQGNLTGWTYKNAPIPAESVIHFRFFNPYDDIRGLSPLESARVTMETDYRAVKYNEAFFKNSAEPGGILSTAGTLTDEQFRRLINQWEQRHGGESRAHRTALLEGGLEYKPVSASHKEMDFLEQRKFSLEEILGVYGVPKAIALTQDLRFATAQTQRKAFWLDTILPQMTLIEEKLNGEFFPRFAPDLEGYFDLDQVEELREDIKDKVEIAKSLWAMGFTANEINERLDLGFEPQPWRDTWWAPVNLVPVDGETPEERTPPSAELPEEMGIGRRPRAGSGELEEGIGADSSKFEAHSSKLEAHSSKLEAHSSKLIAHGAISKDGRSEAIRRQFLVRQQALENGFERKLNRYLFEQRKKVLGIVSSLKGEPAESVESAKSVSKDLAQALRLIAEIAVIWTEENNRLSLIARPLLEDAVMAGGEIALATLGLGIAFDLTRPGVADIIQQRTNRLRRINDTIWNQMRREIREGLTVGETLEQIAGRIRDLYNMARRRSQTIARTETASAINESTLNEYRANGVARKRWITAHDEKVRPTHKAAEEAGPIPVSAHFVNGMSYPGDMAGGPSEVINCRCCLAPVISDGS